MKNCEKAPSNVEGDKTPEIETLKQTFSEEFVSHINDNLGEYRQYMFDKLEQYRKERNQWGGINPATLAGCFDITLLGHDFSKYEGLEELKGFSVIDKGKQIFNEALLIAKVPGVRLKIIANTEESSRSLPYIIAHEVAHCLLMYKDKDSLPKELTENIVFNQKEKPDPEYEQIENLCHEFAKEVLMPSNECERVFKNNPYYQGMEQEIERKIRRFADNFNVTYTLAEERVKELGLIK